MKFLHRLSHISARRPIGNKARGLKKLLRHGYRVPDTWVIPADAKERCDKYPENCQAQLRAQLKQLFDPDKHYAVRSSGELEDSTHYSYAGQFTTVLNVQGIDSLLDAVVKVWESAETIKEASYADMINHPDEPHGMGVVIQEMIDVQWSGVAFSINPVTGRSETVIEGIPGSGEKLVQQGITPQRWIHHQGTWEDFDATCPPPMSVLQSIVDGIDHLRRIFKGEVDIEWGWDGAQIWYLQCRSVTSSRFPTIYSNHISREVLPGMIKPLVWSINIPLVNSAWIRLLSGMLGKLDIRPEELSRAFYFRAYFNMGTLGAIFRMMGFPRDSLESLMGRKDPSGRSSFRPGMKTMRYLPGMVIFLFSNLNLGGKFKKKILILNSETDQLQHELPAMQPQNYHQMYRRIYNLASESAYWNILIPLTMQISNRMLQKKINKRGQEFNQLEFSEDFPDLLNHDPRVLLAQLSLQWNQIPDSQRAQVKTFKEIEQLNADHPLKSIQTGLEEILDRFGHFSESGNDFSSQPWRENPEFVFEMMRDASPEAHSQGMGSAQARDKITPPKRPYRRAGQYRLYREMISSSYTRTYGLFRNLFLITGSYLSEKGYLKEPEDVFYLTLEEHDQLITGGGPLEKSEVQKKVNTIKNEMDTYRDITLPSVIYGETPPPVVAPDESTWTGIPTSPGKFEGEIVVVKGYEDFKKEVEGRILVIPFSDVGWTPILSRAGAIVAESGGLLSHASIIARELSIPAISSVDNACTLSDGTKAIIDGNHGVMTLII